MPEVELPKNPLFLVASAILFFLPAYYVFSDDYGGNPITAVIGSVANLLHMGWLGLFLMVGGITTTVLAYRHSDENSETESGERFEGKAVTS